MSPARQWNATWSGLGLTPPAGLYEQVRASWAEPHRAYHTLRHLAECLAMLEPARSLAIHPAEVEIALWFHDAVYDTRAADSEERSAEWARQAIVSAGGDPAAAGRVAALILATKHAGTEAPSGDAALLLDVDLAILGAGPTRFLEYEDQVRQEYSWVPEPEFRKARAAILDRFLARPAIYATAHFRDLLERQARANLDGALRRLRG